MDTYVVDRQYSPVPVLRVEALGAFGGVFFSKMNPRTHADVTYTSGGPLGIYLFLELHPCALDPGAIKEPPFAWVERDIIQLLR